jgi:ubiquinone/menaquinone biosynthesis C-methylase UbiE
MLRLMTTILLAASAHGCTGSGHGHGRGHDQAQGHGNGHKHELGHGPHGAHGNPLDLERYLARLEGPDRAEWQKPDEVVHALGLQPGQVACDIGAGPGYFALRLARAVGESGTVYGVEVEPKLLPVLRDRLETAGLRNVVPVLALPDEPLLPPASCDLILIVNTYHHFPAGPAYLRRLARSLKPGGRIANVDFHKRELPVGPPLERTVAREQFIEDARAAGLGVIEEYGWLPHQYFLVLQPG